MAQALSRVVPVLNATSLSRRQSAASVVSLRSARAVALAPSRSRLPSMVPHRRIQIGCEPPGRSLAELTANPISLGEGEQFVEPQVTFTRPPTSREAAIAIGSASAAPALRSVCRARSARDFAWSRCFR